MDENDHKPLYLHSKTSYFTIFRHGKQLLVVFSSNLRNFKKSTFLTTKNELEKAFEKIDFSKFFGFELKTSRNCWACLKMVKKIVLNENKVIYGYGCYKEKTSIVRIMLIDG